MIFKNNENSLMIKLCKVTSTFLCDTSLICVLSDDNPQSVKSIVQRLQEAGDTRALEVLIDIAHKIQRGVVSEEDIASNKKT